MLRAMWSSMSSARCLASRALLLSSTLVLLLTTAVHADWRDDAAHAPPAVVAAPAGRVLPRGVVLPPTTAATGTAAPIAAAACYAGPVSCALFTPQRPGTPCHCRGRSGLYWGSAQ
jgi:hypothetical protein